MPSSVSSYFRHATFVFARRSFCTLELTTRSVHLVMSATASVCRQVHWSASSMARQGMLLSESRAIWTAELITAAVQAAAVATASVFRQRQWASSCFRKASRRS